jgi:copper(I)-binding protein
MTATICFGFPTEQIKEAVPVTRLTRRMLAGAIVALIPALAGCEAGLNAPTLNFHPAAGGAYQTSDGVTISNAFVLGPAVGQTLPAGGRAGVFLSMYSTGNDQLKSVKAAVASAVKLSGGPVNMSPYDSVNLTGPAPRIVLSGLHAPLSGGQTIWLTLDFATAGSVSIQVPVEPHTYAYATYAQPPKPAPTPTATTTRKTKAKTKAKTTSGASATPTATPTPTA